MKIIRCPACGEEIELRDLYEGMEASCEFCGAVMIFQEGKFLFLETNEEFEIEDLEEDFEEEDEFGFEEEEEESYFEDEPI